MATKPKKVDFLSLMGEELKSGEYTEGEIKAIKKLGKNLKARISKVTHIRIFGGRGFP